MKMRKAVLLFAGWVMLGLWFGVSCVQAGELLQHGDAAPEFSADAKWFGGKKQKLADYKGKKAVLLYFLKPACGSCDEFSPHLYRLMLKNKKDLQVIGISEYPEKDIAEYVKKRLGNYAVVSDPQREIINQYLGAVDKYPFVALIDKEGKVAWVGRGKFHAQVTQALMRVLGKEEPQKVEQQIKKRYAVVVSALNKIDDDKQQEQVDKWLAVLKKSGYGDVEVAVCGTDDSTDAGQSFVNELTGELQKVAGKATADDLILFYFSGDGKVIPGNKDISLKFQQSSMNLSAIKKILLGKEEKNRVFMVLDAEHEGTDLPVWEDIAEEIGKANPEVSIMLAAARWDYSVLNKEKNGTVFADMFFEGLSTCGLLPMNEFWLCLRNKLLMQLRGSGKLQTPFICNPGTYSLSDKIEAE